MTLSTSKRLPISNIPATGKLLAVVQGNHRVGYYTSAIGNAFIQISMTEKIIAAIRDQVGTMPAHMVNVLEIVSVKFDTFTPQLTNELNKYQYLQMLTLNDCGIKSLAGFPHLPGLIRLDMVFNEIPGADLVHLTGSRHLQTLMLGANKVASTSELVTLQGMRQLFQLDLINNPVQSQAGYRPKVFGILSSLTVLDTLDKSGKDAFNTTSMVQTASRVPAGLFDTSRPVPSIFTAPPAPAPTFPVTTSVPKTTHTKRGAKAASTTVTTTVAPTTYTRPRAAISKASKSAKTTAPARSLAGRAGIVFPVTRIKRHLRGVMIGNRISPGSAVYMAAVLEYLTAEVVELAGVVCKGEKKARITPRMLKLAIDNDDELKKLLNNTTIPREE